MSDGEVNAADVVNAEPHDIVSLLSSAERDYLVRNNGDQVPISELEGKIVCLYFSLSSYSPCAEFTPKLVEVYEKLKGNGENFKIVLLPLDDDEESFKKYFEKMPWFSLPIGDKNVEKLARYFELSTLPTLVVIGADGKTLSKNVADAIDEHGSLAYPFTPEKFAELDEIEKAKEKAQTLESLLISGDRNFVIGKDETEVPVTDLVGKNILLYFSAHWCPPCRAFLPKLIEAYHEIKAKDDAFEIIFISSDRDQTSFDDFFAKMPWLALPFGDERKVPLSRRFKVQGIPMLVAIGPTGKTVTKETRNLVELHGANAYPFTEERLKEMEVEYEEMAKGWPEKLKSALQEMHELVLTRRTRFTCDKCDKSGLVWSFYCKECDFNLPPKCALEADKETENDAKQEEEESNEGGVCDGDVCTKGWPKKLKTALHEKHELVLMRRTGFTCDKCDKSGLVWSFCCKECDFDLHPKCALEADKETENDAKQEEEESKEGGVCDGDVCTKGWPEKLKSALHEKHELVLMQRTRFTCDKCDKSGLVWSFCCKECDFDLHPKCALEADKETENDAKQEEEESKEGGVCDGDVCTKGWPEKLKSALHEKHELVLTRRTGFTCDKCDKLGLVWSFCCKECDFDLHPKCALEADKETENDAKQEEEESKEGGVCDGDVCTKGWPEKLKSALHEKHELVLMQRTRFTCDKCDKSGLVWSFCCKECDFDLHPKCALEADKETENDAKQEEEESKEGGVCDGDVCTKGWPEKLKSVLHEKHELVLMQRTRFTCDKCDKSGLVWSFCCKECDFDLHPKCALEADKETENDAKQEEEASKEGGVCDGDVCTKGWPEKLKSALHEKHELVLTRRTGFTCDKCDKLGLVWSFCCKECDFDLHPKCALEADKETENDAKQEEEESKEGGVCDGDVCTKGWPEKLKSVLHEKHELVLMQRTRFTCDKCDKSGLVWSFCCKECDFDLHPKCALEADKETENDAKQEEEASKEGGFVTVMFVQKGGLRS